MTDSIATAQRPVENASGEMAMSRLADRIASMAPPPLNLTSAQMTSMPRPSPAVAAALSTSAAISARAAERARRSRSIIGLTVDSFVSACSFIPYALVALALRLVMARVFFLDGQTRVAGPRVPLNVQDFDLSVVLPLQVKVETFGAFLTQYAALPVPPVLAAYLVSYAEFILPICLVLGFGTRFAALGMLVMTALIQIYVMPEALWSVHVYWASILLVLLSRGPGQISVDHIIRFIARR
jgi:putative oxidoreductase